MQNWAGNWEECIAKIAILFLCLDKLAYFFVAEAVADGDRWHIKHNMLHMIEINIGATISTCQEIQFLPNLAICLWFI